MLIIISSLFFSACSYKQKPVLLKPTHKLKTYGAPILRYNASVDSSDLPFQHKIQPDNRILIIQLNTDITEVTSSLNIQEGFLVDLNGNVHLPIVGDVYVQGLTRQEAARMLEKVYSIYFKNPMFQIEIKNLQVTVIGGSGTNTGGISVPLDKEKTHLLEVLGKSGGIPNFTKIKYVRIIRGEYKDPQILIVDMSQLEVIGEKDLIMQNGDVVYLEPRAIRLVSDATQPYISLLSFLNLFGTIYLIFNVFNQNKNSTK